MRQKVVSLQTGMLLAVSLLFLTSSLQATSLNFSGNLTGTAIENPAGRCAPFITVDATGTGSSTVLGSFNDIQSHCTTSLSTFGNGLFTLASLSQPTDSLFGIYSGTASVGPGGVLDFSSILTINHGTGRFAGASGSLDSSGTLDGAGIFKASFNGLITPAPEPATFYLFGFGLTLTAYAYFLRRRSPSSSKENAAAQMALNRQPRAIVDRME